MDEEALCVVLDTGSYRTKAGFSGADQPQTKLRTLTACTDEGTVAVGDESLKYLDSSIVVRPVHHGIVRNWAMAEKLWRHLYIKELKVDPSEHPLMLSEPTLAPKIHREKICQIMFEVFDIPGMYIAPAPLLALYGTSRTVGLVIDIGEGVSQAVPVNEGTVLPYGVTRIDVGGYDLTSHLLFDTPAFCFENLKHREIANEIKERFCYVSQNYMREMAYIKAHPDHLARKYTLPDGSSVVLTKDLIRIPEIMFNPQLGGWSAPTLADVIYRSIRNCDPDDQRILFTNILLTGGCSLFPGFLDRCDSDIRSVVGGNAIVKVDHTGEDSENSVWVGGSIVAALSSFQQMWVTREDYEESGPTVIHRKCF